MYARATTWVKPNALVKEAMLIALLAALTALGAQIAVRLPFSPVPITLQVLLVVVTGLALGSRRGFQSQLAYLAAGAAGMPVFANGQGGLAYLLGPTGGYLFAFPVAAWVAGWLWEHLNRWRDAGRLVAAIGAIAVIYGGGVLWLAFWLGSGTTLTQAWSLGVAPFIAADLLKAVAATAVVGAGRAILPRWFGLP